MAQTGNWNHIALAARLLRVEVSDLDGLAREASDDKAVKDASAAIRDLGDRLDRAEAEMKAVLVAKDWQQQWDAFAALSDVLLYFFGTMEPEALAAELQRMLPAYEQLSTWQRCDLDKLPRKSLAEIREAVRKDNP